MFWSKKPEQPKFVTKRDVSVVRLQGGEDKPLYEHEVTQNTYWVVDRALSTEIDRELEQHSWRKNTRLVSASVSVINHVVFATIVTEYEVFDVPH